ncbi:UDP-N-acetylglucosamine 1-carboxyvinyltransferase [soil metagenome]
MDSPTVVNNKTTETLSSTGSFEIIGGARLQGEITPQGAKNEALQILCAVLLTSEKVVIENIPDIRDVNKLIELLERMGVVVEKLSHDTYAFEAGNINMDYLTTKDFSKLAAALRGSIMIVGPLLARFGKAHIPKPGGDKIGRRRLDTHFIGFQNLGAKFDFDTTENFFTIEATKLKGAYMLLDEASVTGTANIVMAAVMAEGTTTIYNAACEPYLQQLCKMLNRMGAKIIGIGSNLLVIEGVTSLKGTTHKILPDMIEVGSFIGLAAMTQSEITIKNVGLQHLGIIPTTFQRLGIKMEFRGDDIYIPAQEKYEIDTFIDGSILTVSDAIWPGFTPDLISVVLVTATQAVGTVLVHQKMFESRLFFVDKLIDMGAQIILCDPHRATVIGLGRKNLLKGIQMVSPDIRAGVALLIAALSAKGKSVIHNIEQIDRGYERIDERLNALGANIKRV